MANSHPLHQLTGRRLTELVAKRWGFKLLLDTQCGGQGSLPLYDAPSPTLDHNFCNVDFLILENSRRTPEISVIGEIEESDVEPVHIFGKFMASAMSRYYAASQRSPLIPYADTVHFIQVLSTREPLRARSKKPNQWTWIEAAIQGVIPRIGTPIATYRVFHEDQSGSRSELTEDLIAYVGTLL